LKKIPKGKVTTYKELALVMGTHSRAIARILAANKDPENIPCYKVVRSDGSIGGYTFKGRLDVKRKIALLKRDGIEVKNGKIDLKKYLHRF